jgi:hypothetical protein
MSHLLRLLSGSFLSNGKITSTQVYQMLQRFYPLADTKMFYNELYPSSKPEYLNKKHKGGTEPRFINAC